MADQATRVWHIQIGAPGTILGTASNDRLWVRFDGATRAVELDQSQVLHTDPKYYGATGATGA